jgi:hypothetical protein
MKCKPEDLFLYEYLAHHLIRSFSLAFLNLPAHYYHFAMAYLASQTGLIGYTASHPHHRHRPYTNLFVSSLPLVYFC